MVLVGAACALAALSGRAFGQAADSCGDAPSVGVGTVTWDLAGATNDGTATCGFSQTGPDVWLEFVAPASEVYAVSTCGLTTFDTVLSVFDACGGAELLCNDQYCGNQSEVIIHATAGTRYLVRVALWGFETEGFGEVSITSLGQGPANDVCTNAAPVGEGTFAYDTRGATTDGATSCAFGDSGAADVWWLYTPTFTGRAEIQTCGLTSFNTHLNVFDACGGAELACNDNFCGVQSRLLVPVTQGVPVLVRLAGSFGQIGSGEMSISQAPPAPPNDDCATATPTGEATIDFDNLYATTDGASSCGFAGNPGGNDLWWAYTPSFTGSAEIQTCGATFMDTQLSIYDACGGTELACNDDFCFLQSRLLVPTVQGVPMLIRLAGWDGQIGTGQLIITQAPPPPANDNCATADAVSEGVFSWDNTYATTDGAASCGFGGNPGGADLWWAYSPTFTGTARASTCGIDVDTQISVYDACGGSEIACNDDFCGLQSRLTWEVVQGATYWVRVAGWNGVTGAGAVTLEQAPPPPANDNCDDALAVGDGVYPFDTTDATNDGPGSCGASETSNDVWFLWTVGSNGCAVIETCGSPLDTVISTFDACGGFELFCNDESCGSQSQLTVPNVVAGTEILVRVSAFANGFGSGTLTLRVDPQLPYVAPGASTPEGEACLGDDAVDTFNGGCNLFPPLFGSITCGETVLGSSSGFLFTGEFYRDTDWFEFSLPADDTVTLTGQAQFEAQMFLLSTDCGEGAILAFGTNNACSPDVTCSAFLPAGTYRAFISPRGFGPAAATCGVNSEYWISLSFGAGCGGAACDPDVNCDGSPDQGDVACMILAVAGDTSCICQDPDFNLDGSADQGDVAALIGVVAGQPCP